MKKLRKIFALLIAMVMVLGMSTSVFAASIEITSDSTYDGSTKRTYSAYKIFDADTNLDGSNTQTDKTPTYDENGPIAYYMATNSKWLSVMQDNEQIWFNVDLAADSSKYVVTLKDGVDNNDTTAQAIATYLNNNIPDDVDADYTITVDNDATTVADGYYLIVADDGAPVLTLVTADVTIVEKNTYISTGKTTSETSYSVDDTVTYTATVTIPSNTKTGDTITLHDTMDSVLAFNEDASAKIGEDPFTAFTTSYDDDAEELKDTCTFELYIPVTADVLGKTITFTYTAKVTSAAATDDGFVNELFGEYNGYKTTPDTPNVYTFDFDFVKNFADSDEELTAKFELRTTADDEDTAISFIKDDDGNYVKADSDDVGASAEITMTNGKQLNFLGFKAGTYYLVETETSTGYNLLDGPVTVIITDTTTDPTNPSHGVSYIVNGEEADGTVTVLNQTGSVLPSTGGIGTTIFYIVGAILVIGAGIVLVTRRRMNVQ